MPATLPGLEDTGIFKGAQERATEKFIDSYRDGKTDTPAAEFIYSCMLSLARNIDAQNARGREISRNMTTLLDYIRQLEELYPPEANDSDLMDLLGEMGR